jgi:hypothetical protein
MSDDRERIRALRAKAKSTEFPAEAEALEAKARELEAKLPLVIPDENEVKRYGFVSRDEFTDLFTDVSHLFSDPHANWVPTGRAGKSHVHAFTEFNGKEWVNGIIIVTPEEDIVEGHYRYEGYGFDGQY